MAFRKKKQQQETIEDKPAEREAELVFSPSEKKEAAIIPGKKPVIVIPRLKSMRFRMWISFVVMTLITVAILWAYGLIYYSTFYVRGESAEVEKFGQDVVQKYDECFSGGFNVVKEDEFKKYIDAAAIEKNINIVVENTTSARVYSATTNSGLVAANIKPAIKAIYDTTVTEYDKPFVFFTASHPEIVENLIVFGFKRYISGEIIKFYVTSDVPTFSTTRNAFLFQLFIITGVSIIIGVVVAFVGSNFIAKPIHDVTIAISNSSRGTKNEKISTDSGLAEIDELATAYNKTLDKVEENARFRRDLLANISHDMKTPLTMIRAYSEMIRDLTGGDKEKSAKNASIIISESDRLTSLISEVIELSKLESGIYELHPAFFSISEMIKESVRHFEIMQMLKGYTIDVDVEDNIFVNADSERIERVLYNLIGNAINYTGDDKKIGITCKKKKGIARVEISDTGKGLTEEEMKDIWVKYYRLVQDKRKVMGSGLGLTIVKSILDLHGSTYGVKSIKGKGSTFWFELPVYSERKIIKANQ